MRATACISFLSIGLLASCSHVKPQPSQPSSIQDAPAPASAAPQPLPPQTDEPAAPVEPVAPANPVKADKADSSKPASSEAAKPTAAVPIKNKPKASLPAKAPVAASTAPNPSAPAKSQLDFKTLVQRLRDTSAIGVFTKLSIKNQVDDLLKAFRGYYAGQVPPSLDDLHQRYDGLLLKVVTLVQDNDGSLASDISQSRGAIWERLSNRESFQAI